MLGHVGGHSAAAIAHPQPHVPALLRPRSPGDGIGVHGDVTGVDDQGAAARHSVAGVDREIHEHLLHLAGIRQHWPQAIGQRGDQLDMLANGPAQYFLHRSDDGAEVNDLRPDHVAPGEDEQLAG